MPVVGVGIDIVETARLATALARTPSLADRLFHPAEVEYAEQRVERLAVRFAAKEAVAKALAMPGFRALDVEVTIEGSGRRSLHVTGETADRASVLGVTRWHVSLAHDAGVATAVVIAESDSS